MSGKVLATNKQQITTTAHTPVLCNGVTVNTGNRMFRAQCWDVDQRGTVGETILHLCMLSATQTHFDLAKRLLKHFPDLINDIYLGEEYYGEFLLVVQVSDVWIWM